MLCTKSNDPLFVCCAARNRVTSYTLSRQVKPETKSCSDFTAMARRRYICSRVTENPAKVTHPCKSSR